MTYTKSLKHIFIISFTIAILYPLVNSQIVLPSFTDLLVKNTEDEARKIGLHLSDFVVLENKSLKKPADFVPQVEKARNDFNLEKIKVFSEEGEIVYSTSPDDVGKMNTKKYFLDIVAKGEVFTRLARKDSTTLEGRTVSADVIETYVPIFSGNTFIGAFEIYYDITEKNQIMNQRAFRSSLISYSLVFGFFILIGFILFKADERSDKVQVGKLSSLFRSPFYLLLLMFGAIFAIEIIIMFFISTLPPVSRTTAAVLDSSLLVMLVSPFLYFFLLRPLLLQIEERDQVEHELKKSHAELEKRVNERTSALAKTNRRLVEDIKKRKQAEELLSQTKKDWEDTFDTITDMITIHDRAYNIVRANKAAEKFLELPLLLDAANYKCYTYYHGTKVPPDGCESCKSLKTGKPGIFEIFEPKLEKYVEIRAIPRFDRKGEVIGLIHVVRDITQRKQSDMAVHESEERYRSLVESTEDSIYLVDRNYKYLFMNKMHHARLGISENKYLGKSFRDFHSPEETNLFVEKVDRAFSSGESVQFEYKSLRNERYYLQTFSPVKNPDGIITAVTIVSKDITDLKKIEKKLHALSITDELTGLYNRRGFFSLADKKLKLANRMGKGVFLLYADLDNLKVINDRFGHHEGDEALKETSVVMKGIFRGSDIIARIGGDEFVILAFESPETNIRTIATRLKSNLDKYNAMSNKPYELSMSLGIKRLNTEHPASTNKLLSEADKLMYEQKKKKRHIS